MAARRNSRALYELVSDRATPVPGAPRRPTISEPAEDDGGGVLRLLSPGRVLRIPIGYLLFAVAGAIVLVIAAYVIGYDQREREYDRQAARELASAFEGMEDPARARDRGATATADGANAIAGTDGGGGAAVTPRPEPAPTGSTLPNVWLVGEGVPDPREPGLNYFVLASTIPRAEAERLARFVGERGIGVVVLPRRAGNGQVTPRRGFAGGAAPHANAATWVP